MRCSSQKNYLCIYLFIHFFIYLFIYFIYLFIYLFTYDNINSSEKDHPKSKSLDLVQTLSLVSKRHRYF